MPRQKAVINSLITITVPMKDLRSHIGHTARILRVVSVTTGPARKRSLYDARCECGAGLPALYSSEFDCQPMLVTE